MVLTNHRDYDVLNMMLRTLYRIGLDKYPRIRLYPDIDLF